MKNPKHLRPSRPTTIRAKWHGLGQALGEILIPKQILNSFSIWKIRIWDLFRISDLGFQISKIRISSFRNKRGFTLLEMTISIGIFSVIVITAIGIMVQISATQIKANNLQTILDNIRFSLELITKEMRTGNSYAINNTCGPGIKFKTSLSEDHVYYLDPSTGLIMRATQAITGSDCDGSSGVVQPFSSDDVLVEKMNFDLHGENSGPDDGQSWATISLQVKSRSPKYELDSSMNVQTTIVQRIRELK